MRQTHKTVKEIWRTIPGFEEYKASNLGRIKRAVSGKTNAVKGRIMRFGSKNKLGHLALDLCRDGKVTRVGVHVCVCLAFKGLKPSPLHEVAHADGDPSNNRPYNVRWATHKENGADMGRHGRVKGSKNPSAKLNEDQVRIIRQLRKEDRKFWSFRRLGEKYGVDLSTIHLVCTREHWSHVRA